MRRKIDEDSYQFNGWYNRNKDNYVKSLQALNLNCKRPSGFPSDLVSFGTLKKGHFGPGQNDFIWLVELPPGCQVYHSSRSMVINNSGFPIPSYKIAEIEESNKNLEARQASEKIDSSSSKYCLRDPQKYSGCATSTYYASDPNHIKEYLHKGPDGFLNEQVNYSYGYDNIYPQDATLADSEFNNRLASKANEYLRGILAYETKKPSYLVAMPDYFFMGNNFISLYNNLTILGQYTDLITSSIGSASGMSLQNNLQTSVSFYKDQDAETKAKFSAISPIPEWEWLMTWFGKSLFDIIGKFEEDVWKCIQGRQCQLDEECLGTAYYITYSYLLYLRETNQNSNFGSFKDFLRRIFNLGSTGNEKLPPGTIVLPGFRMSTYDADRPYHSLFRLFFMTHKIQVDGKPVQVDGLLGGYSYNPRFDPHSVIENGVLMPRFHYDTSKNIQGLFHSEIILFYAPDVLEKSVGNPYDDAYSLNSLGILSDFRKYKTTNRLEWQCDEGKCSWKNFHQGHLFEHSSWTAINALNVANRSLVTGNFTSIVFLVAGALHDIGKAGGCGYENFEWAAYDPHTIPKTTQCRIISTGNNSNIGFSYYDIPIHPERGYSILYGTKFYEVFDFIPLGSNRFEVVKAFNLTFKDWEKYRTKNEISDYSMKLIRISTGAHYYLSIELGKYEKSRDEQKIEIAAEYLRKIELYYNSEFLKYSEESFVDALLITMIVSYADVLGSMYDINLTDSQEYNVYNEYPDYHLKNYEHFLQNYQPGTSIEQYMVFLANTNIIHGRPTPNPVIFGNNIGKNFESFRQTCITLLHNFVPHPHNSFLTLENLMYGFDTRGIYRSYWDTSYVPKVLIFDLDETLLHMNWRDEQENFHSVLIDDKYDFVPDIDEILDLCKYLRKRYGVIIAIATRHFLPLRMLREVNDINSPLYHDKFDIIISQYTGVQGELDSFCKGWRKHFGEATVDKCFHFTEPCEDSSGPNCNRMTFGFRKLFTPPGSSVNWDLGTYDPTQSIYLGVEHKNPKNTKDQTFAGKIPHMLQILEQANIILNNRLGRGKNVIGNNPRVSYSDMILYDDSEKYILPSNSPETLGGDVFTAGVTKKGLTFDLFEKSIAIYAFQNLAKQSLPV